MLKYLNVNPCKPVRADSIVQRLTCHVSARQRLLFQLVMAGHFASAPILCHPLKHENAPKGTHTALHAARPRPPPAIPLTR